MDAKGMKETEAKPEHNSRSELINIGLDEEFVSFLSSSEVESFAKALTNESSYISASALHEALSVFENEAHAAIIYILENNFGVRTSGQNPSTLRDLKIAFEAMFGSASSLMMVKVEAAMKAGK